MAKPKASNRKSAKASAAEPAAATLPVTAVAVVPPQQPADLMVTGQCNVDVDQIISIPLFGFRRECRAKIAEGQQLHKDVLAERTQKTSELDAIIKRHATMAVEADTSILIAFWKERKHAIEVKFVTSIDSTKFAAGTRDITVDVTVSVFAASERTSGYRASADTSYKLPFAWSTEYMPVAAVNEVEALRHAIMSLDAKLVNIKAVLAAWQHKLATERDVEEELRVVATASAVRQLPRGEQLLTLVSEGFNARYMKDMPSYEK